MPELRYAELPAGNKIATIAADRLLGFFPRSAASDPQIFLTGLIELLAGYPEWLLLRMCSVKNGLPSVSKFMPSIAEVCEYCDNLLIAERRHAELVERYNRPALPPPTDRSLRPDYEQLKAKHGRNWGIADCKQPIREQTQEEALQALRDEFGGIVDMIPDQPQGRWKQPLAKTAAVILTQCDDENSLDLDCISF